MSTKLTSVAVPLLCLLAACDSGGLDSHRLRVPVRLAFGVPPTAVIAGAAIRPAVTVMVQDDHGNTVTDATTEIHLGLGNNPGNGSLSGTVVLSAVNGVATFSDLSLDRSGRGYTLTADAQGLGAATSLRFNVSLDPTTLAFVVQPNATAAGHVFAPPVTIAVLDDQGNTVESASTSVTVRIGTNPSGATLGGTAAAAVVNGIARFSNLVIDNPGNGYVLTASASGLNEANSVPFDVRGAFVTVSAGIYRTCAVSEAGTVYCWGFIGLNKDWMNDDPPFKESPVAVGSGLTFTTVSTSSHSCGRTISGAAYCWGDNEGGQLGSGSTTSSRTPVKVTGELSFAAVSAGGGHTCGLTTTGAVYCWGDNSLGQLGNGSRTGSTAPTPVAGGLTFTSVSSGSSHSCGVTTAGAAYCWGANGNGQLGDGSRLDSSIPVAVAGGLTFAMVSSGSAVVVDSREDIRGGPGGLRARPLPDAVSTISALVRFYEHTCGMTLGGEAYCWGGNSSGQLGNGSTTDASTPVLVAGDLTFAMVTAGGGYSCGVTASGAAYCWGDNGTGQLGNGSTTDSSTPLAVTGSLSFASVAAAPAEGGLGVASDDSAAHTCGITKAGVVYCWGWNVLGQLGNGTLTGSSTPIRISNL